MTETFTHDRASFRERIARLVGGTTWREPLEGHSTDPRRMTDQDVAAALAYARQGADDIGPDIAYCIVCNSNSYRRRSVSTVAQEIFETTKRRRGLHEMVLAADAAWGFVVWGRTQPRPDTIDQTAWDVLVRLAVAIFDSAAESAIHRAERCYRNKR